MVLCCRSFEMANASPPTTPFQTIRRERTSGLIVEQLERAILAGHFQQGDRLPTERELAEQFRASRSSVREGLRLLEQRGLVEVRRGAAGGAFVAAPGSDLVTEALHRLAQLGQFDLDQLYAARHLLEPAVADLAARDRTRVQIQALEASVEAIRVRVAEGRDTAEASHRFHLLVAEATRNPVLVLLTAALLDVAARLDAAIPHPPRPSALVVENHEQILRAIRDGDRAMAESLTSAHLAEMRQRILREREAPPRRQGRKS